MTEFINTSDVIGDSVLTDLIISRAVTEYKDDRVEKLGTSCFARCTQLTIVDVPFCKKVWHRSFYECSSLVALILRNEELVSLGTRYTFTGSSIETGTGYIYVPVKLLESYKAATGWSEWADQIRAIEDYPDITGGME